ncbi:MAG: 6-carboxyhexanoate--CoA ligase [Desulfovibrio sp.]|jgi:6-carboxyhexanoate--CoA ligase|nr:6-carboxyhexanoate--CoA ligase [Desulfovibrio sp.]
MLYSLKIRAECQGRHISGAERMVAPEDVEHALLGLLRRTRQHPNGEADSVALTLTRVTRPLIRVSALPVSEVVATDPSDARRVLYAELTRMRLNAGALLSLFDGLPVMRGAALVDGLSLARLEPDPQRGIRAANMDYADNREYGKHHFREALCLASKVAACPHIAAELCVSDDIHYTTGYFSSKERGYIRITNIKKPGDSRGARMFIFRGAPDDVFSCIEYLEQAPVLIEHFHFDNCPVAGRLCFRQ